MNEQRSNELLHRLPFIEDGERRLVKHPTLRFPSSQDLELRQAPMNSIAKIILHFRKLLNPLFGSIIS